MENVSHWNLLRDMDAECYEKFGAFRSYLLEGGVFPRKTTEILLMSMCCAIRFSPGIRVHAERALEQGATKQEIFGAVELATLVAGAVAFREAASVLEDVLR